MEWNRTETETTNASNSRRLHVVRPGSLDARNETFNCLTKRLGRLTFPVCVYSADVDRYISAAMAGDGYFEAHEVGGFLRLLTLDRRLQLVDVGANIGVYSLPAARLTQVLAVEPNPRSIARLAKAVELGAVGSNITLVQSAVSNVRTSQITMFVNVKNQVRQCDLRL